MQFACVLIALGFMIQIFNYQINIATPLFTVILGGYEIVAVGAFFYITAFLYQTISDAVHKP